MRCERGKLASMIPSHQFALPKLSGVSALAAFSASSGGYREVVKVLPKERTDVNAQGEKYGNALQAASSKEHGKLVHILFGKGADNERTYGVEAAVTESKCLQVIQPPSIYAHYISFCELVGALLSCASTT